MTSAGRETPPSYHAPAGRVRAAAPRPVVVAAADAGSNSVHLLVARLAAERVSVLADESVFLGLGEAAERGWFGRELRTALVETLIGQVERARALGAGAIALVGTEPLRRAADAARVVVEVERSSGLPLAVLSQAEEGLLTLLGVSGGRPVLVETHVVDIGGGSCQIVEAGPGVAPTCVGLAVGSARLTAAVVRHDPPTRREWGLLQERARQLVATALRPARRDGPGAAPARLVVVGGTATNLGRLVPDGITAEDAGRTLTPALVDAAVRVLLGAPAEVVAERFALRPARARVLPAGAAILLALFDHYGVSGAEISAASLREGLVTALERAGRGWRDRLPELVSGGVVPSVGGVVPSVGGVVPSVGGEGAVRRSG